MARLSAVGPGTEAGKQILSDFKNWKTTGFKPWGSGVGGVEHYRSRQCYQVVSQQAFKSQAQKIAQIAKEQMPASEAQACPKLKTNNTSDDESFVLDSENKNPWERKLVDESSNDNLNQGQSDDDAEFSEESDDETVDNLDGFVEFRIGELQNSMSALLTNYPCGTKLLAVFPLDGNILDQDANQFQFINDNTAIQRWSKVPEERKNAMELIGLGSESCSALGFTEIDLVVLDAEIKKRLEANSHKKDSNGDIWEIRETLTLPFKCHPKLYNKKGEETGTFRTRQNNLGFAWAYFWLLAWTPAKARKPKRISGKMVKVMRKDDASIYTEQTVRSTEGLFEKRKKKPMQQIQIQT